MDYYSLGKTPISEELPAGEDVRYQDEFEQLQAEIDKLGSPTTRESFSWSTVVDLASGILNQRSKDLLVASYLCAGLINTNGAKGLSQAVAILDDLIANFWESLFPAKRRITARAFAIEWWLEKTEEAIDNGLQLNVDSQELEETHQRIGRIQEFLEANSELDISAEKVGQMVKDLQSRIDSEEDNQEETSPPKTQGSATSVEIDDAAELSGFEDALKHFHPVFQKFRQASKVIREDKSHFPHAYRWLRFALWEPVKALPAAKDGITKLPPPSPQTINRLETLQNEEEWEELLFAAESALNNSQHIFLLDLNWFSANALLNLGQKYRAAYEAVCLETYLFTKRLPGLEELYFSDGSTPFASEETQQWLQSLSPQNSADNINEVNLPSSGEQDKVGEAINEARRLLKDDDGLVEAVNFLQQKISSAYSGKVAFLLRLELVRILVSAKKEKTAVPHLDMIWEDFSKFRIDAWEPEIALDGLKNIYKVFKKQSDAKYKQKAEAVFNMIASISTVDAMNL